MCGCYCGHSCMLSHRMPRLRPGGCERSRLRPGHRNGASPRLRPGALLAAGAKPRLLPGPLARGKATPWLRPGALPRSTRSPRLRPGALVGAQQAHGGLVLCCEESMPTAAAWCLPLSVSLSLSRCLYMRTPIYMCVYTCLKPYKP